MNKLVELKQNEVKQINGGGARPGPSTLGLEFAHMASDFIFGFAERFTRYAIK